MANPEWTDPEDWEDDPTRCQRCGSRPTVINLDNDDLCQPCANAWVRGEGQDQ